MRRWFSVDGPLPPILLPVGGALLALALARTPAQAEPVLSLGPVPKLTMRAEITPAPQPQMKTKTFFISQKDGYGLSDCLRSGAQCGQVVANSWCAAHGWGIASAWGSTNDMTASTGARSKAPPQDHIAVTCSE